MTNKNHKGEVRIPADAENVWKHEIMTAHALAKAGYSVEFLPAMNNNDTKSPDILMDGMKWEIKAPKTDKMSAIERNLKRATKQSGNIIIDSQRLHRLQDRAVQRFLVQKFKQQKTIKRLLFVNRRRETIDISTIV